MDRAKLLVTVIGSSIVSAMNTDCGPGYQRSWDLLEKKDKYCLGAIALGDKPALVYVAYCYECAAGCFNAGREYDPCKPCAIGTWSLPASSTCDFCAPGYGYLSHDSTECLKCHPGTFAGGSSGSTGACTSCPNGTTTTSHGSAFSSACSACSSGYFGVPQDPGVSASGCTICPAGTWSNRGSEFCLPCPPGTFSLSGRGYCTLCPQNTFGSQAGLTDNTCSGVCEGCPEGSTSSLSSSSLTCGVDI